MFGVQTLLALLPITRQWTWAEKGTKELPHGARGNMWGPSRMWVAFPFSRASSQPRDRTQVSHIAGNSLPAEPQGKSKNTGVGSLSLLQGVFPTQGLNPGLPHCRRILYQLSHKGSRKQNQYAKISCVSLH